MFNKLKQFKDLRSQAKLLQDALKQEKVDVEKSGVKITMDGNQEVVFFSVDESLLIKERKADLEQALKEAVNKANEKVKRVMAQKMQSMGGFDQFGFGKK